MDSRSTKSTIATRRSLRCSLPNRDPNLTGVNTLRQVGEALFERLAFDSALQRTRGAGA